MHIWNTFNLLVGVLVHIQVQCFQEGICPKKDPPRGVQVLAPGTEVTLHCSGRISVNGLDIAQTRGVSTGRSKREVGEGAGGKEVPAELGTEPETTALNRAGVEELGLVGGAGETLNLTGLDRGRVNRSEVRRGRGLGKGAAENGNASAVDGAYGGALGPGGQGPAGLGDAAQWRVNGRTRTSGGVSGDTLLLAPLRLCEGGNYSCHRGGKKVFAVEIIVAAPLEQPAISCYRRTPTSKIRCDWTANEPVRPTPQCYLILKKGLSGQLSKVNCSFTPSRARCWCAVDHSEGEKDAFQATLCLTSITGNVTSPPIQIHPENIIKPEPPANVTVHAEEGMEHRLKVKWKYPRSWSTNFYRLKFQLEYFPILNGEAKEAQVVLPRRTSHTINDILPRTTYLLRVRAMEEFGLGQWSDWSPQVYARAWTAPEPSASSDVYSSSYPFDPFFTGSGDGSGSELPSVSPSLLRPTLTVHLSWVLAVCVLLTVIVLAIHIHRHREQFISKLLKLARSSTSHNPSPTPPQQPREEGNPLVSPGPSLPPLPQEEERSEGIHLSNMGYFLVQTD